MSYPFGTVSNMRSTGEGGEDPGPEGQGSDGASSDGASSDGAGSGPFGEPVFPVPDAAMAVVAAVAEVAVVDLAAMDDRTLLGMFDAFESSDRRMAAARFALLSELDARNICDRHLGHVTANEAGWRHGANPRRVNADLAVGKVLRSTLDDVWAALAAGDISADRVRELCRHVNDRNRADLASVQDRLIDLAGRASTFRQFASEVEQLARLLDQDGIEPPMPRNHATVDQSADRVTATLDLYGADAMAFATRVNAEADRLWRLQFADGATPADTPGRPRSELLAQAFMNLVEHGAANPQSGRLGPTADITIVIDADETDIAHLFADGTLLPGKGNGPVDWSKKALDITGEPLRFATREWELLTCDATYSWIIKGAGGHPVACKSGERHASREQRRNLDLRDGRCTFPGCDAPANWCDAHHVTHWTDHGPTEIPNLALLCRRHHGVIHRHGWTMEPNVSPGPGEGFFIITTPGGATRHTQHQRPPAPT